MKNLQIKELTLKNYCCFDDVKLNFTKDGESIHQWTVFLGNNNTGKTSILKAIAELRPYSVDMPSLKVKKKVNLKQEQAYIPVLLFNKNYKEYSAIANFTGLEKWGVDKGGSKLSTLPLENLMHIYGYGVSRYPASTSLSQDRRQPSETLFSADARLTNLEEWLMQLDYASKNMVEAATERLDAIKRLICSRLFPEIQDFKFESSDELHNYVLFQTKDGWFRYTQLGYGYQSMLSWIVDLCKRMFDAYPESQNPLHEGAIVLVDEIDLHLHPKWQRDIISYLTEAFPKVQFIVTTHSPLVIQSMEDINLYVLNRGDDGKVCIEKSEQSNYSGWTVEEILRDTMRLESGVYSDAYNEVLAKFNDGLDEDDKVKVEAAFEILDKILHPNNPIRRMFKLQKDTM